LRLFAHVKSGSPFSSAAYQCQAVGFVLSCFGFSIVAVIALSLEFRQKLFEGIQAKKGISDICLKEPECSKRIPDICFSDQ